MVVKFAMNFSLIQFDDSGSVTPRPDLGSLGWVTAHRKLKNDSGPVASPLGIAKALSHLHSSWDNFQSHFETVGKRKKVWKNII
jgi:hypothetical protein